MPSSTISQYFRITFATILLLATLVADVFGYILEAKIPLEQLDLASIVTGTALVPTSNLAAQRKRKKRSAKRNSRSSRGRNRSGNVRNASEKLEDKPEANLEAIAKAEPPKPKRGKVDIQLDIESEDGIFWDSAMVVNLIPQFDRHPGYDSVRVRLSVRSDSMSSRVHWDTSAIVEVGDEVKFRFKPREPGFFWLQSELYHKGKLLAYQLKKAGYQPQWFFPAFTPPADIKQFWLLAKLDLDVVSTEVKMKPGPRHRWPSMQVFSVSIPSTDGVMLHGWLTMPKASGAHPVILELPPYGNSMRPDLETRDMAVLRLDVRGHGRSRKPINPGFPGFMTYGLPNEEDYIYRGVVQDCLAAVRFLKSLQQIDAKRIGVMGVSQGGGLASMTACLDSSIKAMAVSVPFMCNWSRYFVTAPWPKRDFQAWVNEDPANRKMEKVLNTLSYFDPANLAIGCKAKIFMAVGLQDMTCPPDGAFAWYNTMAQQKEVLVYKDGHHILPGVRGKMMSFMRQVLKGY